MLLSFSLLMALQHAIILRTQKGGVFNSTITVLHPLNFIQTLVRGCDSSVQIALCGRQQDDL